MDFSKLSREDWMVGAGGILLIIGLLVVPWFITSSVGPVSVDRSRRPTAPERDLGHPRADRHDRSSSSTSRSRASARRRTLPTTQLGRDMTRAAAPRPRVLLLLLSSSIAHVGNLGWGLFVDMILAIVVVAGRVVDRAGQVDAGDEQPHELTPAADDAHRRRWRRRRGALACSAWRASSPRT